MILYTYTCAHKENVGAFILFPHQNTLLKRGIKCDPLFKVLSVFYSSLKSYMQEVLGYVYEVSAHDISLNDWFKKKLIYTWTLYQRIAILRSHA